MRKWFEIIIAVLLSAVRERRELALENLALRQQLAVMKFRCPQPTLTKSEANTVPSMEQLARGIARRTVSYSSTQASTKIPIILATERPLSRAPNN